MSLMLDPFLIFPRRKYKMEHFSTDMFSSSRLVHSKISLHDKLFSGAIHRSVYLHIITLHFYR